KGVFCFRMPTPMYQSCVAASPELLSFHERSAGRLFGARSGMVPQSHCLPHLWPTESALPLLPFHTPSDSRVHPCLPLTHQARPRRISLYFVNMQRSPILEARLYRPRLYDQQVQPWLTHLHRVLLCPSTDPLFRLRS